MVNTNNQRGKPLNKILLIEDNEYLREINQIKLQYDCQAIIKTTSSASAAIKLLQENNSFDFIVCDYQMPDGDGINVLKYLEEVNLNIPFVFFTSTTGLRIETKYPHYLGIVFKFDYEELVKLIMEIF